MTSVWDDYQQDVPTQSAAPPKSTGNSVWDNYQQNAAPSDVYRPMTAPPAPKEAAAPAPTVTPTEPEKIPNLQWSDVPGQAVSHLGSSAYGLASNIGHALIHPIQTAETLGDVGMGVLEKMGIKAGDEHVPMANAVGKMFADRYGGMDNLKQTIATDPLGFAMDASALLGGGGALLRGAGMAGAADVASTAARLASPLTPVAKAAQIAGKGAAEVVGGLTHTGATPLEEAAAAGRFGGSRAQAFREQLTGKGEMSEPVNDAERALDNLVFDQKSKYMQDMQKLGMNTKVLDLMPTANAVVNMKYLGGFGQTMSKNPVTQATWQAINKTVSEWGMNAASDPSYLTPIGMDGLKRQIGKLGPHTGESGAMISQTQNAIRQTILKEAPEYGPYMKTFEEAQQTIDEIRSAFSLNDRASVDTKLRKLQSIMRDNVNTSYGYRRKLAEYLQDESPDLMARLAGQALNPYMARGLGKLAFNLGVEGAGALVGMGGLTGGALGAAAVMPFMSPRLMGNVAYRVGQAARPFRYTPFVFQAGRAAGAAEERAQP